MIFFFFNDTATTEIYTLSLHDALPISRLALPLAQIPLAGVGQHGHHELLGGELRGDGARSERRGAGGDAHEQALLAREERSEEHTSELQSPCNLVCRLLLEKKK